MTLKKLPFNGHFFSVSYYKFARLLRVGGWTNLLKLINIIEILSLLLWEMAVYNFRKLCSEALADEETTIRWLQHRQLLKSEQDCPKCDSTCRWTTKKGRYVWRCPRKGCQAVVSFKDGSFYSGSHLRVDEILPITYWWATEQTVGNAMRETCLSNNTIEDWYNFHRDVCVQYFQDHPNVIGGPGKVVEIDESKFGKRKYSRGRAVEGHWVFGGMERDSNEGFLVEVQNRDSATLFPILQKHVRPGTTVMSDSWAAYKKIHDDLGFDHQMVNHSLNFVDPLTGAHTQRIESAWSQVKRMMRRQGVMGTSPELFPTYLAEFLWRRKFSDQDKFTAILDTIKEQYHL